MTNVFDVAKYILNKQGKMTTFKLQKLVYYSQAWSLVWDETPLFKERIYAWANGPVCETLYKLHAGMFDIGESGINGRGTITNLNDKQKQTIDAVLKSYGHISGQRLSYLTHTEEPWVKARKGLSVGERGNQEITHASMYEYFSPIDCERAKK